MESASCYYESESCAEAEIEFKNLPSYKKSDVAVMDVTNLVTKLKLRDSSDLWKNVIETTKNAKEAGALFSIETKYEHIIDGAIEFIVRESTALAKKPSASHGLITPSHKNNPLHLSSHDPFQNPEPELFVQELSDTHQLLLNKYNVVDYHLLVVTIDYEPQTDLINSQDFAAAWFVEAEIGGLTFFNGGNKAGASQPHKHLQFVPLPLLTERNHLPIEPLIFKNMQEPNKVFRIGEFPFSHAVVFLDQAKLQGSSANIKNVSIYLERTYFSLFEFLNIDYKNEELRKTGQLSYNFLMTRKWMLIVIRSSEKFENIAVNSLGFSGTMLVRNEADMKTLKVHGPMKILAHVASV